MKKAQPFFATTPTTFQGRFPNISTYEVRIEQDRSGYHSRDGKPAIGLYTEKANLPARVGCVNPRCRRGGLSLEWYLHSVKKDEPFAYEGDFFCDGDEGSPGGQKKGDPCLNRFHVEIRANGPASYKYRSDRSA